MVPIAFLFFCALYLIFERFFVIRAQTKADDNFIDNIRDMVAQGNIKSAESFAKNQRTAMGRVFEKAIGRIGSPIREIESTVETVGQIELARLERNMGYLGIIAGIAPMLGFIGTISGLIRHLPDRQHQRRYHRGWSVRKDDYVGCWSDRRGYFVHGLSPAEHDDRAFYAGPRNERLRVYRSPAKANHRAGTRALERSQ